MSKLDRMIKNSLQSTPNIDPSINRQLAEKFAARSRNAEVQTDDEEYEIVLRYQAKPYKKPPFIKRFGAIAACAALIAAIGSGGFFALSRVQNDTEDYASDMSDEISEISETEETLTAADKYGMATKEDIYAKMFNTCFYFDNVSAEIVESIDNVKNTCYYLSVQHILETGESAAAQSTMYHDNSDSDILSGSMPVGTMDYQYTSYCNGNLNVLLYDDGQYSVFPQSDYGCGITPRSGSIVSYDKIRAFCDQYEQYNNGEIDKITVNHPNDMISTGINSPFGLRVFRPLSSDAGSNMYDFKTWDIAGETKFLDRDCVSIHYKNGEMTGNMLIDMETGCMLKYELYEGSRLAEYVVVQNIEFDQPGLSVEHVDLSELVDAGSERLETYLNNR